MTEPTFKFSAVVSRQREPISKVVDLATLSCGHIIIVSPYDQRKRYKCPKCYPPRERTFMEMHPGNRHSSAWDAVRQERATRTHVRSTRNGKGVRY